MLQFPYQDEPLTGAPLPSLPLGSAVRWRPLIPVTVLGPTGLSRQFGRALLDTGADDTVFPLDTAAWIAAPLRPDAGHRIRWRGQPHPLRFGDVQLELAAGGSVWRWSAVIAFSPAPLAYPVLGNCGCLQFFDARFRGAGLLVDLETNRSYPGTTS
jgi:hypothetical protein